MFIEYAIQSKTCFSNELSFIVHVDGWTKTTAVDLVIEKNLLVGPTTIHNSTDLSNNYQLFGLVIAICIIFMFFYVNNIKIVLILQMKIKKYYQMHTCTLKLSSQKTPFSFLQIF